MDQDDSVRLNKYLALRLGISRREADELIEQGKVSINDQPARLGAHITPQDTVNINHHAVTREAPAFIYLALNKPTGYVCSRRAQGENPTIYELLPAEYHPLKTVGRLDRDSSGLILLTNDGDFAFRMTHPKFAKTKEYLVRLDHDLEPLHQQMISDFGVDLPDGRSQLSLMRLDEDRRDEWQVTMSEGRNRQIRRTFAALGYEVKKLHRIQFGNYSLDDIPRGEYRIVDMR